jgi:hypothetical protein
LNRIENGSGPLIGVEAVAYGPRVCEVGAIADAPDRLGRSEEVWCHCDRRRLQTEFESGFFGDFDGTDGRDEGIGIHAGGIAAEAAVVGRGDSELGLAGSESTKDTGDTPATAKASSVPAPAGGRGDATDAADLAPPELAGAHQPRRRPLPWARLFKRVFFVDALSCPRCLTPMVVLTRLSDPPVV